MAPHNSTIEKIVRTCALFAAAAVVLTAVLSCRRPPAPLEGASDDAEKKSPIAVEYIVASRMPLESTVDARGIISAGQGKISRPAPAVAGRLLSVLVKEGDYVSAGHVIAVIDNQPQQAAVAGARSAVSVSEALAAEAEISHRAASDEQAAAVRLANLTLATAKLDRDGAVRTAENQLLAAETDLKKTKNGPRAQEVVQADQAVTQANVTRNRAHGELERTKLLLQGGIASRRQLEDAQSAADVAESAYKSAMAQASLMHAGARPEDVDAAQIRVDGAAEALKLARADGEAHVAQAEAAVHQAKQSVLSVQAKARDSQAQAAAALQKRSDLAAALATAQYSVIRAPFRGTVTKRLLNPGDMADSASPVVEISDTRDLNLLANLPSAEGRRLRPGMSATITSRDMPSASLPGAVISVGQVDPNTNLLAVRIRVEGSTAAMPIGSFALATIVLGSNQRSIVVPKAAILSRDAGSVVFVAGSDDIAHQKEVETGAEHGGVVAVNRGIATGDRVIVVGAYELADGDKIIPILTTGTVKGKVPSR